MFSLQALSDPWTENERTLLDRDGTITELLSPLQRKFRDDGFVILRGFLDIGLIEAYRSAWLEQFDGHPKHYAWNNPCSYMLSPEMLDLLMSSELSQVLHALLGEPAGLHLTLADWRSTERKWHQDGIWNQDHVADHYVSTWIPLETVDPDAGPFEFSPGTHRAGFVIRRERMRDAVASIMELDDHDWPHQTEQILTPLLAEVVDEYSHETFLGEPGDVLIYHARIIHRGSIPNTPNARRPALLAHYSGIHHRPDMTPAVQHERGGWFFPLHSDGRIRPLEPGEVPITT
jgi:hypothetical protein